MSTPQTLNATRTVAPHHLDHRNLRIEDRYLPPPNPRPSSNLSNGYQHNIPARPSSNLSYRELPPPHRPESGAGYTQRGGEYATANGYAPQQPFEELRRTNSRSSQTHHRQLPPLPPQHQTPTSSRAPVGSAAGAAEMPSHQQYDQAERQDRGTKRRQKSQVDWVAYFGGKPPTEIIEIHDDDSPAPSATIQRPPPPTTNGSSASQHVDKKRRVNGGSGEVATYSTTNTPYSHSNGASTDSLQNTTAPTSLGSQASSGSRVETAQTGQKRKRTARTSEVDRKKHESDRPGHKGYLAEYGEYVPPPKQFKKLKDVNVQAWPDVCLKTCDG